MRPFFIVVCMLHIYEVLILIDNNSGVALTQNHSLYNTNKSLNSKTAQVHNLFLVLIVLVLTLLVFNLVGFSAKLIMVLMGIAIFAVSFVNTEVALFFLIFSMLLSPEFSAGSAGARDIAIRGDDVFLGVVLLGWIARMAVNKDLALFKYTPLNWPLTIFAVFGLISTLAGMLSGFVKPLVGFFYWLKAVEYFLLFSMVSNIVVSKKQAKRYIYMILGVAVIACLYAWFQRMSGVARVTTPFEGESGEANTLGGYIVMIMLFCLGIFLNVRDKFERSIVVCLLVVAAPVLLFTLSRGSWLAFVPASVVLGLITPRGKFFYSLLAVAAVLFAASLFPQEVKDRFYYTFEEQREYTFMGYRVTLDESAAARVDSWQKSYRKMMRSPIIGRGYGSVRLVDNQYARILEELGVIGILLFFWFIIRIFRIAFWLRRNYDPDDCFFKGLICGYIAAVVSLLFHSFSAATFIIIRIMMPFWFVTGIIIKLPYLMGDKNNIEDENGTDMGQ